MPLYLLTLFAKNEQDSLKAAILNSEHIKNMEFLQIVLISRCQRQRLQSQR
jgi:hypothetical protein